MMNISERYLYIIRCFIIETDGDRFILGNNESLTLYKILFCEFIYLRDFVEIIIFFLKYYLLDQWT